MKSDAFDAFVLADSLRHEHRHWRPLAVPSPLLAELKALTRDRERLIGNQRDTENQLRAIVLEYHPSVLHLFSSLDRGISLAFLRDYPVPAKAARVTEARMAAGRGGQPARGAAGRILARCQGHLREPGIPDRAGVPYPLPNPRSRVRPQREAAGHLLRPPGLLGPAFRAELMERPGLG